MGTRRSVRSWALEVGLGLVALALGAFFLITTIQEGETSASPAAEAVAGALAFAGLVLFRRTRPVALTLVLIPLAIVFGLPMGAVPVALFAVALHRPARVTVALTVLHAAITASVYRLVVDDLRTYLEAVLFIVLLHVTLVAVAMLIRSQRLLIRSWAIRAQQAEEGQRLRIEEARHAERERIAREMHDVLAHRISLLAVHAGALEVRRDASVPERQAAGVIRQCAYDALEDLREVIGMLRDPGEVDDPERPQPTLADLPALVEQSRRAGTDVTLVGPADPDAVSASAGRHAYRIVQEALTNARKHAPGAPVRIRVAALDGLTVEVTNPLPARVPAGIDRIPGAGAGLIGLTERVHLAGGRLEHGSTGTGDFRLLARLP